MEGCSKKSAGAASGLPDDLLVDILSRVPAKSVCRFRCVSTAWRDLIDDPDHRKKLCQAMQGLFVQMREVDSAKLVRISFRFIDLAVRSVPLHIDGCFSFLTEVTGTEISFLDSCNGLLLFRHCEGPSHGSEGYMVCNPTTRQWSAVPARGSPAAISRTLLAFDPAISSNFHLVEFQMPYFDENEDLVSLHAYSSEIGTWSQNQITAQNQQGQLEGWHHHFALGSDEDHRAFVNGFLHLVVWDTHIQFILVVDVQGKARWIITVPCMTGGCPEDTILCYLGQSQGHLYCMTIESGKLSTWVLQDYDTQEWVLKNTVYTFDVFGERQKTPLFHVVEMHQDCNVIFFIHQFELIAYNMDHEEVSVIAAFKDHKYRSQFARYIPYFSESPALTNKY